MLILVSILIFLLGKMDYILVNESLDKAVIFFISVSHIMSRVIVKPKSLNVLSCFILPSFGMNVSYSNV